MGLLSKAPKQPKEPKAQKPVKEKKNKKEQKETQKTEQQPQTEQQTVQQDQQILQESQINQQQAFGQQPIDQQSMGQQLMGQNQIQQTPQQQVGGYTTENNWINESRSFQDQALQSQQNAEMPQENQEGQDRSKIRRPNKRYKYTIVNAMGKKEKGNFDAESEDDVRSFLLAQDYKVLEVAERDKYDIDIGKTTLKAGDLSFALTQLSTYLRAGIPLADSVRILAKQTRKPSLKKSYSQLVYELLKGEDLSTAMELQGDTYPKMLVNMVKTSELTGDLPSILDDMAEYYTSMDQTKKQMKSAMTYPIIVLTLAFGVLIFMLTYLVPQFSTMFEENGAELPTLTQSILNLSAFIKSNWIFLIIGIAGVIIAFVVSFKKIQKFRKGVQITLMHLPVFKSIIIYNEIANFTKTFASLLNHGVFITDSMEILSKVTSNEVYKEIIENTLVNLAKGDTISTAFRGQWAIPIVAYEMIVTGETTGQLGAMMEKVAGHFQVLHKNVIDQMKSLVEPFMIVALAGIVGVILISIVQPMFSIYSAIQ